MTDQTRLSYGIHNGSQSEIRLLLRQSPPLIITSLLQFVPYVLTTVISGHLGPGDLVAASIGAITMAITGYAFVSGMVAALDTLCAQTYGSGDVRGVGLHVRRMSLLILAAYIPIGFL
ncbi:hypothetical protein CEP52_016911 [Fusarium oligoseptatum]|uniref:MATE family efflux transporter n=1 Tax=Fusarium oligoseptatum TaxID=2604345 RepID=A0A428RYQ6_9HYPO|nr:hypothetical protein CEP52_016911 [Fusarium oligoseptatum]